MATETSFAALPVRQRETLEIIDTAMKLYRRYFGVLMGWSALSAVLFVVTLSATCGFGGLLAYPLIPGAGCCVIAAAVRGQNITFGQVWDFTKPRYGALLLITFLAGLLMAVVSGVLSLVSTLISVAGVFLFSAINAPDEVTVVVGIIGTVFGLIVGSVLSVLAYAWFGLIPIIACLEDDKRSTAAMGRAWDLMKGSWKRVLGLATLLSIAILAVMGIVGGSMALYGQSLGVLFDDPSESAILGLGLGFSAFVGLFFLFWNPIQTLVLAVLYLDLRVRKEALDLEWSSYASAPPPQIEQPMLGAVDIAPSSANPELSPASMSGYAPESSVPAAQSARPPQPATAPAPDLPTPPQMRPPVPDTSAFAPQSVTSVSAQSAIPMTQANVMAPQAEVIVPQAEVIAPQAEVIAPQAEVIVLRAEVIAPQAEVLVPQSDVIVPRAEVIVPQAEVIAPRADVTQITPSLSKETSSFSAAPSAPSSASPTAPDTFDFSSSFNPEGAGASSFSPDDTGPQSADDSPKPREDA